MIQASIFGRALCIKSIATKTGKPMTVASCAVNLECRGSEEPETEWIGLVCFGKHAEHLEALPKEERDRLNREAMHLLGNPEPGACTKDGNPLWTAETLAECTGANVENIEQVAEQFGAAVPDETVTVLKQPEPRYLLSPKGAVILGLAEWADGYEKAIEWLDRWVRPCVPRELRPVCREPSPSQFSDSITKMHRYGSPAGCIRHKKIVSCLL